MDQEPSETQGNADRLTQDFATADLIGQVYYVLWTDVDGRCGMTRTIDAIASGWWPFRQHPIYETSWMMIRLDAPSH